MIVVLTLPLLTNSIILESAFEPPNNEDMYDQSDIDKGYIIKHYMYYITIIYITCIRMENID